MLVALINTLGLTELVGDALGSRKQKEAQTNAKIVDLLKHALDETKNCRNEQQRVEVHIALACVMPARETRGTNNGWIARICERLGLKRGKRSQRNGGRPSVGIRNREKRVADIVVRQLKRAKPGAWACIQAREVWSTEEEDNMRTGHFWI